MLKPQMPNIPGVGAVSDTLDFVKNLWGSMSVPGINLPSMAAPTLSVDELDKKIADLKAVESWLNLNVSMLRGTIQALEVQRGTIATLKSMGATLANAVKQPGANEKTVLAAAPYASAFFAQPAVEPAPKAEIKPPPTPAPKIEAAPPAKPEATAAADAATATAAAAMANPVAWWNMLQDQFKQAVTNAMSSEAAAKLSAASAGQVEKFGNAIAKNAPKPAAKQASDKPAAVKAPAKPRAAKPKAVKKES
ncbi:MAG TPA: PhaM family polyhydroxyalkanoate granule multifunctional regulatory protein [Telluria sp.]|jgi:hypothetical protein